MFFICYNGQGHFDKSSNPPNDFTSNQSFTLIYDDVYIAILLIVGKLFDCQFFLLQFIEACRLHLQPTSSCHPQLRMDPLLNPSLNISKYQPSRLLETSIAYTVYHHFFYKEFERNLEFFFGFF